MESVTVVGERTENPSGCCFRFGADKHETRSARQNETGSNASQTGKMESVACATAKRMAMPRALPPTSNISIRTLASQ